MAEIGSPGFRVLCYDMSQNQLNHPLTYIKERQLPLFGWQLEHWTDTMASYRERLLELLSQDLGFHDQDSAYAAHNFHAFPAKFPPQLPRHFILGLTKPGECVLDPMMGSGTTVLEAFLTGRFGIGCDIDPLARLLTQVKTTVFDPDRIYRLGNQVLKNAYGQIHGNRPDLVERLNHQWDQPTRKFVDYWYAQKVQVELMALKMEIEKIPEDAMRSFFQLVFSAIIITKSGGVSLALDLAHTRPHRAKVIYDINGNILEGEAIAASDGPRLRYVTKQLRSPLEEFSKRLQTNIRGISQDREGRITPRVEHANAQSLPIEENSIDLIVTSPPYASNAIDYMRAHKFSLIWFDFPIQDLTTIRQEYVGGESITQFDFEPVPDYSQNIIQKISHLDEKKGRTLHRYYSEMTRVLHEYYRVLKPGKAAILVVGNSVMRNEDTDTAECLADIGRSVGFDIPMIGVRELDRNRRMLPAGMQVNKKSQIQQRMHEEFVIGYYKPD